jgi:outer membrane protein
MKNFPTILNVLLLAAVAGLYYLHFTTKPAVSAIVANVPVKTANIVFVNSDSLLEHYDYFKNKKTEFEEKQGKVKADLKAESTRLQNDIQEYQKKAETMTSQQRQQTEEQLSARQQQFMQKKDELLGKLDEEQSKTNDELYLKLTAYMKEYNKTKNYSFILGHQKGGGILYASDSLDITRELVTGLNSEYEKELKTKK